jgi:hypothetical protein
VATTISNIPPNINTDPFTIDVIISGASTGTNYLRIDLYKTLTNSYFGETFNSPEWYKDSDYLKYFPITIQSGINWTGQIQGRVGNPTILQYDGSGTYKIRVRRYTSSGSYNSTESNNSAQDVIINIPISTPAPEPTPTEVPSPTITENPSLIPTQPTPTDYRLPITDSVDLIASPTPYELQPTTFSYNNIYLSEVMVDPGTEEKEWIEIFNDNDFSVSLNNWFIDDLENSGSTPKIFSLEIDEKSYGVFDLSSSIFNNDGDTVRLLDSNKILKDDFEYQKTETGKTLGRTSLFLNDFCLQESSKNLANNSCINQTPSPIDVQTPKLGVSTIPTPSVFQSKIISTIKISPPSISPSTKKGLININNFLSPVITGSGQILGTSDELPVDSPNNKSLTNLLCFLSIIYSLLTIVSILFRMKLLYGKNKKFYSQSFRSS